MTNIQVTYAGQHQQTIATTEVAEMVGRNHKDVMRDIRNIITQLGESKIAPSSYFINSTYRNTQNKEQPMFLLTKKGCELYSTRMTGYRGTAFAVAYIERFNEMERAAQSNLPTDPLELALTAALETRKEVAEIREDVDFLKDNMRIAPLQEKMLSDLVKQKALKALGGYGSPAYGNQSLRTKAYKSVWGEFYNYFNITSYKALPQVMFEQAVDFISEWTPSAALKMNIKSFTAQLNLGDMEDE